MLPVLCELQLPADDGETPTATELVLPGETSAQPPTTDSDNSTGAVDDHSVQSAASPNVNDIGNWLSDTSRRLSSAERLAALRNVWVPEATRNFPVSGRRNLKFQHSWLRRFSWLAYCDDTSRHGYNFN